ncbi:hypothetical protein CCR75_008104 [Bremia lactucae]|uniref:Uncharacterized protein n=1 Tax=Bremia lactucae TaxID=4779 RepID=A0A976FN42_BRELC|nr:hypothetical protein CCR75_008104 [Bremia lactucae]
MQRRGPRTARSHEGEHRLLYECARNKYRYRMDGSQREMKLTEDQTLMAWLGAKIFLSEPPKFLKEAHVGAERDEFIFTSASGSAHGCMRQAAPLPNVPGGREVRRGHRARPGNLLYGAPSWMLVAFPSRLVRVHPASSPSSVKGSGFSDRKRTLVLRETEALYTGVQSTGYDTLSHALLNSVHVLGMSSSEPAMSLSPSPSAPRSCASPCRLSDGNGGTPPAKQPPDPVQSMFELKTLLQGLQGQDPMASATSFTRDVMVEQIATPDLLVAEIVDAKRLKSLRESLAPEVKQRLLDEKAAKAHETAQRKVKVITRAAGKAAQLPNVEVRLKLAVAEHERQQAAKAKAQAKAQAKAAMNQQIRSLRYGQQRSSQRKPNKPTPSTPAKCAEQRERQHAEWRGRLHTRQTTKVPLRRTVQITARWTARVPARRTCRATDDRKQRRSGMSNINDDEELADTLMESVSGLNDTMRIEDLG